MIRNIQRDKELLIKSKIFDVKTTIQYLIIYNTFSKLSEYHSILKKLYKESTPIIRYQTRMITLEPIWYQFKKRKKYWSKRNYYSHLYNEYEKKIKKTTMLYKYEEKNLPIK